MAAEAPDEATVERELLCGLTSRAVPRQPDSTSPNPAADLRPPNTVAIAAGSGILVLCERAGSAFRRITG